MRYSYIAIVVLMDDLIQDLHNRLRSHINNNDVILRLDKVISDIKFFISIDEYDKEYHDSLTIRCPSQPTSIDISHRITMYRLVSTINVTTLKSVIVNIYEKYRHKDIQLQVLVYDRCNRFWISRISKTLYNYVPNFQSDYKEHIGCFLRYVVNNIDIADIQCVLVMVFN